MARPERPIDPTAPYAGLARQLRRLRHEAGSPPYKAMARKTGYSVTTLSQAAAGRKLPGLRVALAYAEYCGGDRDHWSEQWRLAQQGGQAPLYGPLLSRTVPTPDGAGTVAEFIDGLRHLKAWAGAPSLKELARLTGEPRSTLGDVLHPARATLPRLFQVELVVRACLVLAARSAAHAPDVEATVAAWCAAWQRARMAAVGGPPPPPARPTPDLPVEEAVVPGTEPPAAGAGAPTLPGAVPPREVLAAALRVRFDALGCSLRRYARQRYLDPGTLSRYLNGRRLPPWEIVDALVEDAAGGRADLITMRGLWEAALEDVRQPVRSEGVGAPRSDGFGAPRSDGFGAPRSDGFGAPRSDASGAPGSDLVGAPTHTPHPSRPARRTVRAPRPAGRATATLRSSRARGRRRPGRPGRPAGRRQPADRS
ncbi:helix-turn-helix transcriptional regulator [Streptomyces sp. NPDC048506]|uniref:helix-turn-helix transcriptional regulator n=1 Tax=Streptomyces sp. NPDC048506 TaxID=3155028 RepID=UPI0034254F5F